MANTQWPPVPCRYCNRKTRTRFVIADDLENPKPYHKVCYERMMIDVIIELGRREM